VVEKEALRQAKLELTKAIKKAKEDSWRELCRMVESDPWGKPYKLVMGKLCKRELIPGMDIPGRIENIIEGLFPTHREKKRYGLADRRKPSSSSNNHRADTGNEVTKAEQSTGNRRSPQ